MEKMVERCKIDISNTTIHDCLLFLTCYGQNGFTKPTNLQCNNTIQCNKIYVWLKRNKQLKQNSSEHLNPT